MSDNDTVKYANLLVKWLCEDGYTHCFFVAGGNNMHLLDGVRNEMTCVAFVHEVGEAAGFQKISRSVFGTDVFLCCVYVIYAYTVLRMRMTQEFNKVMPQLAQFCRRLFGVYNEPPRAAAAEGA